MAETLLQKAQRLNIQPAQAPKEENLLEKAQRLGIKPESKQESAISSIIKSIISPVATIGARPFQAVAALGGVSPETLDKFSKEKLGGFVAPVPRTGTDVVKDIGRGVETVSFGLGGGAVKSAVKTGLKSTLGTAVRTGAREGVKAGAAGGFGAGLSKEGKLSDAALGAGIGAAGGLVLGGTIPVASRAIGEAVSLGRKGAGRVTSEVEKRLAQRGATEAEQEVLLKAGAADSRIATKALSQEGKVVTDDLAKEVVKQGVPEADVALIRSSSPTDKAKMLKMLDIREKTATNKMLTERATDVVGDTFMQQAQFLSKKNKEAGKLLNQVAQRLKGRVVNATPQLTSFAENLSSKGIKISRKGQLSFKGSDFEGLAGAQRTISRIWERAIKAAKSGDALELHRLKSFIDENVSYGKVTEGLSGRAENMLKGLRRDVDTLLDTKFPAYNKVNTQFADTIGQLNNIANSMGRKFRVGDSFSTVRAGTTLRRVLSNTQSRSDLLKLLEEMQAVGRKYGLKSDENIISQVNFADTLESLLGSEAPTSFLGQIEKGAKVAEEIAGVGSELARGNIIRATLKGGKSVLDVARGVSRENQIKSLRALLQREASVPKTRSVFGRPKK